MCQIRDVPVQKFTLDVLATWSQCLKNTKAQCP